MKTGRVNKANGFINTEKNRLYAKISLPVTGDGCMNWMANKNYGYGIMRDRDMKMSRAHRLIYKLYFGEIPKDKIIMHLCNNPSCVRPDHLAVGTNKQNTRYMIDQGRAFLSKDKTFHQRWAKKGEEHHQHKLKEKDVLHIRKMLNEGQKLRVIAKKYNVDISTIGYIKSRKLWSHI